MGSYRSARRREWVSGQSDEAALPVCVYLLERSGLMHSQRNNPIAVSRALTKMVLYLSFDLNSSYHFNLTKTIII